MSHFQGLPTPMGEEKAEKGQRELIYIVTNGLEFKVTAGVFIQEGRSDHFYDML